MKALLKIFLIMMGEGMVILGCKLLYSNREINSVFWLNIIAASIIYLVIVLNMTVKLSYRHIKIPIGELGVFWTFSVFYILFAFGLIISGYSRLLSFNMLLSLHCFLLLFILAGTYFSISLNEHIMYRNKKKVHHDIVRTINNYISEIEDELNFKEMHNLKNEIHSIKEQLQSIAPSDNSESIRMDENFVHKMAHILDILRDDFPNKYAILEYKLNKCNKILKKRKGIA